MKAPPTSPGDHARGGSTALLDRDLGQGLQVAQLQRQRVGHHHGRTRWRVRRRRAPPVGGENLGALFALGPAWRAMARCMLSGSWMSLSSMTVTWMPHSSVWTSRIVWAIWLMAAEDVLDRHHRARGVGDAVTRPWRRRR
jgi:hypothetical protein